MAGLLAAVRRSVLILFALGANVAHGEGAEGCPGLVASASPLVLQAALARDEVGLTFIGHSTFLIETPQGIRIATDYNDYVRRACGAADRDHEQGAFYALQPRAGSGH